MLDLKGYEWSLAEGAWITLQVALLSLVLAMILGMLGALAKLSPYRWARAIATLYTTVIRGIPDLVLMMLIFFGGQMLLNDSLYSANECLITTSLHRILTMSGRSIYRIILKLARSWLAS